MINLLHVTYVRLQLYTKYSTNIETKVLLERLVQSWCCVYLTWKRIYFSNEIDFTIYKKIQIYFEALKSIIVLNCCKTLIIVLLVVWAE